MSRIGTRPIKIEEGVEIAITENKISAKFGQNQLFIPIPSELKIKQDADNILIVRNNDSKDARSKHGLISRLIRNIIVGVKDGFTKELTFTGTGYRVAVDNGNLVLNMGYSHETRLPIPKGLNVEIKKNHIIVKGCDKFEVGQFSAIVRDVRGPEVYKGKGIKYLNEIIKRKAGKKASS